MPSANECGLASVYVRYTDVASHSGISEESIKDNHPVDLVLDPGAGQTTFNGSGVYTVYVVLNQHHDYGTGGRRESMRKLARSLRIIASPGLITL